MIDEDELGWVDRLVRIGTGRADVAWEPSVAMRLQLVFRKRDFEMLDEACKGDGGF
jgi:hypothetical protein